MHAEHPGNRGKATLFREPGAKRLGQPLTGAAVSPSSGRSRSAANSWASPGTSASRSSPARSRATISSPAPAPEAERGHRAGEAERGVVPGDGRPEPGRRAQMGDKARELGAAPRSVGIRDEHAQQPADHVRDRPLGEPQTEHGQAPASRSPFSPASRSPASRSPSPGSHRLGAAPASSSAPITRAAMTSRGRNPDGSSHVAR